MGLYRISAVWIDNESNITDYAVHKVSAKSVSKATKLSKEKTIALLETRGNAATTWLWNYSRASWLVGENIEVVAASTGKYLRSNPNNRLTEHLAHLIHVNWLLP